ncbi:MAG: type 4a pilus biogenesis protein PilO [Deltaproteobacteria bacterium]|nr:type 4a pilus biogenesis protein PilO [Deltaproteobacteria bacterium]
MQALNQLFKRFSALILVGAVGYCGWLVYDYYDWQSSATSELGRKKSLLAQAKENVKKLKEKVKAAEEFYKNLDVIRARIRQLSLQLEGAKGMLSAEVDVASFIRVMNLEAKKLGITIKKIRPETEVKKDYYIEVPFSMDVRGAYVQLVVFFDRIARLQQIMKVETFNLRPTGTAYTKFVELESGIRLTSYKYLGTTADDIGKKAAGGAQ